MYFLGFSINNFTLLALTLAIGIVVDDAIIVLENAYRHQEELGEDPEAAAINGTREIAFAVIATTIALVAVFTPLAFLTGLHRPALQRVRHRGGGLGDHLGLRGADPDADAVRQDPPGAAAARAALPRCWSTGSTAWRPATPAAWPSPSGTALIVVGARPGHGRRGLRVPLAEARVRAAGGPGLVLLVHHRAGRLLAGLHRRLPAAGGGDPGQDRRRSTATSAWSNIGGGVSRGIIFTNLDDWSERDRRCRTSWTRSRPSTSASRASSRSPTTRRRSAGAAR